MNEELGVYSVGPPMAIEPKCSNHDFTEGLARELVFNLGGHRVYGMTFSNWVILMSLHKCARTMCYGTLRLLSRGGYGEMAVERVGERKKRRGGRGVGVLLYPQEHACLPKMDSSLVLSLSM